MIIEIQGNTYYAYNTLIKPSGYLVYYFIDMNGDSWFYPKDNV